MDQKHNKTMADLHRLLATQDFKSEKDLKKFLDGLIGEQIPSFPTEALSFQEKAQDLVFEAYELPPLKAKVNIAMAIKLYPDIIEAYEYLGSIEDIPEIAIVFYEKGISIGRRIFGGKYLEEHKGSFWGFHETRPYMRCLQQYADCLYDMDKVRECVEILEEMIELNPNDNQGVREQLLLYLIELDEQKKFKKYAAMFENEKSAFALFNRALFAFKYEGESKKANDALQKALNQNKFVAKKLLAKSTAFLPDYHGLGDENEAKYYVYFAHFIWQNTTGATDWLKRQS